MPETREEWWKYQPFWKVAMTEREKWIVRQWASFTLHATLLMALVAGLFGYILCEVVHG